jgi:hypothetical protein
VNKQIEIYLVTDIESNGPNPVENSMLSLGCVAMLRDGTVLHEFYQNFELRPGTSPDPQTTEWWLKHTRAYDATRENTVDIDKGMQNFYLWCSTIKHDPQFEGKNVLLVPASMMHGLYDGWFLMHHIHNFGPRKNVLSKRYINIPDLAHSVIGGLVNNSAKRFYPKEWFEGAPQHDHDALHDARGEAVMLASIFRAIDGFDSGYRVAGHGTGTPIAEYIDSGAPTHCGNCGMITKRFSELEGSCNEPHIIVDPKVPHQEDGQGVVNLPHGCCRFWGKEEKQ